MTSFWCHNDVIITSCVQRGGTSEYFFFVLPHKFDLVFFGPCHVPFDTTLYVMLWSIDMFWCHFHMLFIATSLERPYPRVVFKCEVVSRQRYYKHDFKDCVCIGEIKPFYLSTFLRDFPACVITTMVYPFYFEKWLDREPFRMMGIENLVGSKYWSGVTEQVSSFH